MATEAECRKFWYEKVLVKEAEVKKELEECRKRGKRTSNYETLIKDCKKLKDEYEAMTGRVMDPHDINHVESANARTARQFLSGRHDG